MKIVHITSIDAALSIMRTGTFRPVSSDPLNGDAGLNAFDVSMPGEYNELWFSGTGAQITFEWDGPVDTRTDRPYPPNVLQDQMPYRVFVPVGTTQHLTLIGFEPDPQAWDNYELDLPWYYLTPTMRRKARRRALIALQAEIDAIIELRPAIHVGA